MRHILKLKMFFLCANTASSDVPDHSNVPASLETPNVISVGTASTLIVLRKLIKLAIRWKFPHQAHCPRWRRKRRRSRAEGG